MIHITETTFRKVFPRAKRGIYQVIADNIEKAGCVTKSQQAMFLAQCGHESAGFFFGDFMSKVDLNIKRGDTFAHRFSLMKDKKGKLVPLELIDVARIDLQAMVIDEYGEQEVVLSLSTTDNTLTQKDNYLVMVVSKKLTHDKEWTKAYYDVQVTYTDNVVQTIFNGVITLNHDVTESKVPADETSFERAIQFTMDNESSEVVVHKESMNLVFGIAAKGGKGESGDNGLPSRDGATFTPIISENGDLSWENNKGLSNPPPVNLKGSKGDKGDNGKSAYEIAVEEGFRKQARMAELFFIQ